MPSISFIQMILHDSPPRKRTGRFHDEPPIDWLLTQKSLKPNPENKQSRFDVFYRGDDTPILADFFRGEFAAVEAMFAGVLIAGLAAAGAGYLNPPFIFPPFSKDGLEEHIG